MNIQAKLTKAFKALRAHGLIARKSFMCCAGCAGSSLGNEVLALHDAGKPLPRGAVYYHRQDAEGFSNPRRGNLTIRFGQIEGWRDHKVVARTPLTTEEVGAAALAALLEAGVSASWNGDPGQCIEVEIPRSRG